MDTDREDSQAILYIHRVMDGHGQVGQSDFNGMIQQSLQGLTELQTSNTFGAVQLQSCGIVYGQETPNFCCTNQPVISAKVDLNL